MSDDDFEGNSGGSGRDDTWIDVRKLIAAYTHPPGQGGQTGSEFFRERDSESEGPTTRSLDQEV